MGFFDEVAAGFSELGDIMQDGFEEIGDFFDFDKFDREMNLDYETEEEWKAYLEKRGDYVTTADLEKYQAFKVRNAPRKRAEEEAKRAEEERLAAARREVEIAETRERFANMGEEVENLYSRFCAYNNGELNNIEKVHLLEDAAAFEGGSAAAIEHYSQQYNYDISQAGGTMALGKLMQQMSAISELYPKLKADIG